MWLHEVYFTGSFPRTDQRVWEVEIADVAIKVWYRAMRKFTHGKAKIQ